MQPEVQSELCIGGIEEGILRGDKRRDYYTPLGYCVDLAKEGNGYGVFYQTFGSQELFPSGSLLESTNAKPQRFVSGEPTMDLKIQTAIVDELIGVSDGLSDPTKNRRSRNFMAFMRRDPDDKGFGRVDVPTIVFKFHEYLKSHVTQIDHAQVRDGNATDRAFDPSELDSVKDLFRLMIAASNSGGKLRVNENKFVVSASTREDRSITIPTSAPVRVMQQPNITQSAADHTPISMPNPNRLFTSSRSSRHGSSQSSYADSRRSSYASGSSTTSTTIPDSLRLENLRCITVGGLVRWEKVKELSSLEMLFHLHTRDGIVWDELESSMKKCGVEMPQTFLPIELCGLSKRNINNALRQIQAAREDLLKKFDVYFQPKSTELLYEWMADGKSYSNGQRLEAKIFTMNPGSRQKELSPRATWILRHIFFDREFGSFNSPNQ